jgi:hypothetical protein
MHITSGRVVFSRKVAPAQYESKTAEVELTFILAEDEELGDTLDVVGQQAKAKALELVGLKSSVEAAAPTPGPAPEKLDMRTKEAKAKAAADKAAAAAALNAKDTSTKQTTASPPQEPSQPAAPASSKEVDPGDDEFEITPPKPITDVDLTKACSAKNQILQQKHGAASPAMIKALRREFVPEPQQLKDIPQEKRAEFLKRLEALQ